jgi:predicted esterase
VKSREYPFEWEHVLALAAPTPTLLLTALNDDIFPHTESCEAAVKQAKKVYELLGASDALKNYTHKSGHSMPREALQEADEWFERWL